MLKNAILDAKMYENFAKIWRNFDEILTILSISSSWPPPEPHLTTPGVEEAAPLAPDEQFQLFGFPLFKAQGDKRAPASFFLRSLP